MKRSLVSISAKTIAPSLLIASALAGIPAGERAQVDHGSQNVSGLTLKRKITGLWKSDGNQLPRSPYCLHGGNGGPP
jgi:hypothetical protein